MEWQQENLWYVGFNYIPVFYEENVGCMLWGLLNGKTQTDLPWGSAR